MSKYIPPALQAHYDGPAKTTCRLLRIRTKAGVVYGYTTNNAPTDYDPSLVDLGSTADDWGLVVHHPVNGYEPSRSQATADLSVDNLEASGTVGGAVTEQMIRAGVFDNAEWREYRINYMDKTMGHELMGSGRVGETDFSNGFWKKELRSIIQQLRQPLCDLYSLTCRTIYGSMPIGTGGEQPESRKPCGKAWVWTSGTVTSVSSVEPDRIFTDTSIAQADNFYRVGVVEWLTGDNAGAQMEVDSNVSDVVTLTLSLAYPISVGDTYRIRQDCDKTREMCRDVHGNLPNMRAEPDIPVSDGGTLMVPGAHIRQ